MEQQAAAGHAQHEHNNGAGLANGDGGALIPRPQVEPGHRIRIFANMQVDQETYKVIQRTIRKLVIKTSLDWQKPYRKQDPEKIALLIRSARTAHAILTRYEDNWATIELLKMYLQNSRGHAREKGYIPKAGRKSRDSGPTA
ncbi:hypothetical protein C8Q77DRAFT_713172 [Trametes polyzona]|nr:hypothetical protein C8Q77DRAFT_713172 [Trametes polyzona]